MHNRFTHLHNKVPLLVAFIACMFVLWSVFLLVRSERLQAGVRQRVSCISLLSKLDQGVARLQAQLHPKKLSPKAKKWSELAKNNHQLIRSIFLSSPPDQIFLKRLRKIQVAQPRPESLRPTRPTQTKIIAFRLARTRTLINKQIRQLRRQVEGISGRLSVFWKQLGAIAIVSCVLSFLVAMLFWLFWFNRQSSEISNKALIESEAHNNALLNSLSDTTMVLTPEACFLQLHPGEDNPLSLPDDLPYAQPAQHFLPPAYWEPFFQEFQQINAHHTQSRMEFTLHTQTTSLTLETRLTYIDQERILAIVRDITEQKRNEYLKDEFIANVSHELRTPLTSIRGALSLLRFQFDQTLDGKPKRLVEIAEKNSLQLAQLIDDLLDVQKMNYDSLEFHFERIELNKLITQSIENNTPYAQKHQIQFQFHPNEQEFWIFTDPKRLVQVLNNLLSNAAKFSKPKQDVNIRFVRKEETFQVEVRDYGIGISKHFQQRLFRKFSQATTPSNNKTEGTGLGLSICKKWIEKLGGQLSVESSPGEGSLFYFELPNDSRVIQKGARKLNPEIQLKHDV